MTPSFEIIIACCFRLGQATVTRQKTWTSWLLKLETSLMSWSMMTQKNRYNLVAVCYTCAFWERINVPIPRYLGNLKKTYLGNPPLQNLGASYVCRGLKSNLLYLFILRHFFKPRHYSFSERLSLGFFRDLIALYLFIHWLFKPRHYSYSHSYGQGLKCRGMNKYRSTRFKPWQTSAAELQTAIAEVLVRLYDPVHFAFQFYSILCVILLKIECGAKKNRPKLVVICAAQFTKQLT